MTQVVAHKDKDDEIKQYHLKRLYELSLKSLGEIPQLDDPTYEQKQKEKEKPRPKINGAKLIHKAMFG